MTKLNIITTEEVKNEYKAKPSPEASRKQTIIAQWERRWLKDKEKYEPSNNAIGRKRIALTLSLIEGSSSNLEGLSVVDMGCGSGDIADALCKKGTFVSAVDPATNAYKELKENHGDSITFLQDCLPCTELKDRAFDLVLCCDVIAELEESEFRLALSELARILKIEGVVVCSTPLDINSVEALEGFATLMGTEFKFLNYGLSYNSMYIRLLTFLKAPQNYVSMAYDPSLRQQESKSKKGLSRLLFRCNTCRPLSWFWSVVALVGRPLSRFIDDSAIILTGLEKINKALFGEKGVSHVIIVAKKRRLMDGR